MAAALFQPFPEQRKFLLFWKGLNFVIGSGYWILYPDFVRMAPHFGVIPHAGGQRGLLSAAAHPHRRRDAT